MCSQIYSHPVEGYKCFANANKSQGTYYTCCDLDTREIRYVTYIYDGYFMGYYLCLLYTSPSPRDRYGSRMPSSA